MTLLAGLVPSELIPKGLWLFISIAFAIEIVKPTRFLKLKWIVFTANSFRNFKKKLPCSLQLVL